MTRSSVSAVIATYNCAELLPNAIRSIYAQSRPAEEVVVINDGSTDDTAEVLSALAAELPSNFVYENKPNGGEASARNRGVALATGDYVAFLDQDDTWLPEKLDRQMALLESDSSLSGSFTAYTRIHGEHREIVRQEDWEATPEFALRRLMIGSCMTPSTTVMRKDAYEDAGGFDESLWLGSDWTMWLTLAARGHRIGYVPEPLTEYLSLESGMSYDGRRTAKAALVIFPRLFESGQLPASVQNLERWCQARWQMINAEYSLEAGEGAEARRQIIAAARLHPASIRRGWLSILARSFRPSGRAEPDPA